MSKAIFSDEEMGRISSSRVLVVGAGGIGCEILKNLVYSGVKYVEIIDLDTIDVSNLNRQFLFRPEHVGRPKAVVAADVVAAFNPSVTLVSHFGNVKDPKFGVSFFKSFTVVLNALDNVDARRHVNRMCLTSEVPLFDSGTTGYVGQVTSIRKGVTSCYDCKPKPTQKVYPICTIRSTPDKPVHCIVWAKECFKLLFGNTVESMLFEDPTSGESSVYMHLVRLPAAVNTSVTDCAETYLAHGEALLRAFFCAEISKKIEMNTYQNALRTPVPMSEADIAAAVSTARAALSTSATVDTYRNTVDQPTSVWSVVENASRFVLCVAELLTTHHRQVEARSLEFDKDFALSMQFVCAAANLRSAVFGIATQSLHDSKGIAGNIIPAIATTNAIVAGVQVLQAMRMLARPAQSEAETDCPPHVYCLRSRTRKGLYLQPVAAEGPDAGCFVCGRALLVLEMDVHLTTLEELLASVAKGHLGVVWPSLSIGYDCIYEEGEGADEALAVNKTLVLSKCPCGGIKEDTMLKLTDMLSDIDVDIRVVHRDRTSLPEAGFIIGTLQQYETAKNAPQADSEEVSATGKRKRQDQDDDGILE